MFSMQFSKACRRMQNSFAINVHVHWSFFILWLISGEELMARCFQIPVMGLFRKALFVVAAAVAIGYLLSNLHDSAPPPKFGGNVQTGFESVERAFRQNFENGFESGGAAFAVCHRGKIVADLWGGYADKMALRPWKHDTITTAFSTTKGVSAMVIAVLVDRGHLSYDDLVIKHWPEFGAHGKANVTVKMLVGHQAGLAGLDGEITVEAVKDWRLMSKLFEDQVPNWPPGRAAGYHALTFGWVCDQLVRRVDPKHRSLGKYLEEEIAKPFGIDFHIGLPRDQLYRVARLRLPTAWEFLQNLGDWEFINFIFTMVVSGQQPLAKKIATNPSWLKMEPDAIAFNNPDVQEMEIGGGNGIGSARGLARLFCLLGGTEFMNKTSVDKIIKPVIIDEKDRVLGLNITWGYGFMHTIGPQGQYQIGHPGYGGQNVKFDPQEYLSFAYMRNHMASDMGELTRSWRNLQHATYESIQALKARS